MVNDDSSFQYFSHTMFSILTLLKGMCFWLYKIRFFLLESTSMLLDKLQKLKQVLKSKGLHLDTICNAYCIKFIKVINVCTSMSLSSCGSFNCGAYG